MSGVSLGDSYRSDLDCCVQFSRQHFMFSSLSHRHSRKKHLNPYSTGMSQTMLCGC